MTQRLSILATVKCCTIGFKLSEYVCFVVFAQACCRFSSGGMWPVESDRARLSSASSKWICIVIARSGKVTSMVSMRGQCEYVC